MAQISFLLAVFYCNIFTISFSLTPTDLLSCNQRSLDPLHSVQNNTVVSLGNCTYTLTSPLNISAVQGLHIFGNDSVINCTGENAGMMFKLVTDLVLEKVTIRNCGMYLSEDKLQMASVQIINSFKVAVKNVTIENGTGTGLSLVNVGGNVTVEHCMFCYNRYDIDQPYHVVDDLHNDFVQRGGGVQIIIGNGSKPINHSEYLITDCVFRSNYASSGGALFIVIGTNASYNQILIKSTNFSDNGCKNGGGALQVGYVTALNQQSLQDVVHNSIRFKTCKFIGNQAGYGGGTAVFSSLNQHGLANQNEIVFNDCSWTNNIAEKLGIAVDVAALPWETFTKNVHIVSIIFCDCRFTQHEQNLPHPALDKSTGVLTTTGFFLKFEQSVKFENNNFSAIRALNSVLDFGSNVSAIFIHNRGNKGGAIKLIGISTIMVDSHSTFLFQDNKAERYGGAIYADSSNRYMESFCFVQNKQNNKSSNVSFNFKNNAVYYNNEATNDVDRGASISATTFASCPSVNCPSVKFNSSTCLSVMQALDCIGNFNFFEEKLELQLATDAYQFMVDDNKKNCNISKCLKSQQGYNSAEYPYEDTHPIIPGKTEKIPLTLVNELCKKAPFHVLVKVINSTNSSIKLKSTDSIISDNKIILQGELNSVGTLQFSSLGTHYNIEAKLRVKLDNCPPGYFHDKESLRCVCSLNSKDQYPAINRCDNIEFKAYVKHGYWLGYVNQTKERKLVSAICPKGFCIKDKSTDISTTNSSSINREYPLSNRAVSDLSQYVCNENREGIICGRCKQNYSVYYRSGSFLCKSNHLCSLGWLFYIVSELLPVTVLFFIVIYFNISFTSGALNGVILFMQIVITLKIDAENYTQFNKTLLLLSRIHKIIYRTFILKILAIKELSFCLWEGATALDMLAFRYVTIVYSLFLVIITVVMLRKCTCRFRRSRTPMIKSSLNLRHSILNGLSAFLVMSYSECAQVTLMILTRGTLTIGPMTDKKAEYQYRAFYHGDFHYLDTSHLKYALPAFFFLLTFVAWPPMLMIVYPLCYKLFALLRIDESKFVKITCKIFPLEKIKPLFDSIQSEFKDQYRFFAGLYFLFRLTNSLTFAITSALETYYTLTTAQLIVMLMLLSMCSPYKEKRYNALDGLLFANLLLINAISFYNYTSDSQSIVNDWGAIQCVLILLPLIYLVVYTVYNIILKVRAAIEQNDSPNDNNDNSDQLLELIDSRNRNDSEKNSINYVRLNDNSGEKNTP